jgi:hypothetical protein
LVKENVEFTRMNKAAIAAAERMASVAKKHPSSRSLRIRSRKKKRIQTKID